MMRTCSGCPHCRVESFGRAKIALRCFDRDADPYWYGRTVIVLPEGADAEAYRVTPPAWCRYSSSPEDAYGG